MDGQPIGIVQFVEGAAVVRPGAVCFDWRGRTRRCACTQLAISGALENISESEDCLSWLEPRTRTQCPTERKTHRRPVAAPETRTAAPRGMTRAERATIREDGERSGR